MRVYNSRREKELRIFYCFISFSAIYVFRLASNLNKTDSKEQCKENLIITWMKQIPNNQEWKPWRTWTWAWEYWSMIPFLYYIFLSLSTISCFFQYFRKMAALLIYKIAPVSKNNFAKSQKLVSATLRIFYSK